MTRQIIIATSLLLVPFAASNSLAQRPSPEMLQDAELTDVVFVDPAHGWAVGDRGLILHTDDAGRHWHVQASQVSCRLESIHFVDGANGWIVGGWTQPYTQKSSGVVLRTRDGGRHWSVVRGVTLPALKLVKFLDVRHGWALGNGSAMYPAGVFRTEDGGRSWSSMPTSSSENWLAGDFRDPQAGIVAGRNGAIGLLRNVRIDPAKMAGVGQRHLRDMKLLGRTNGWLVGDEGLVFNTKDGGLTWQIPSGLPRRIANQTDFRTIAVAAQHCWIAGNPGTFVLHTADYGRTWDVLPTRQPLPIRDLHFVDAQRGWAVGALGTILATTDGGRTWHRQRSGGTRAAMLGIFSEPNRVPWELVAKLSGNAGYLSAFEFVARQTDESQRGESPLDDRAHQAILAGGGSSSDFVSRFPIRSKGLMLKDEAIVKGWDAANDGRAMMFLERHLVRRIRQWRPEVLITETDGRGKYGVASLVSHAVLRASAKAADPLAFPEQLQEMGLEPWSVKKVYAAAPAGSRGGLEISTSDLAVRLGRTLADQGGISRALVSDHYQKSPSRISLRLLLNKLNDEVGAHGVFTGIALPYGGESRRRLQTARKTDASAIVRAAQRRRNIEQLFARSSSSSKGSGWAAQLDDLTKGLNASQAGEILYQLGHQMHGKGQNALAADVFNQLVERQPNHPLVDSVLVWLVQYYSSSEVLWRHRSRSTVETQRALATTIDDGSFERSVKQAAFAARAKPTPSKFVNQGRNRTAFTGLRAGDRQGRALSLGKMIERTRPALFSEPRLRFPLSAAARAKGFGRDADRFYQLILRSRQQDAWWQCAQAETWMRHGRGLPTKVVANCARRTEIPRLDGKLDDPCWSELDRITLRSAGRDDGTWPAVAMICRDDRFLYLAVNAKKAEGADYTVKEESRRRDSDLSQRDRVELFLDLDRDYTSYYRFVIDHRGWGAESCFGDMSWNPEWFISAQSDATSWTVEAAIPLSKLSPTPPQLKAVWAMGLQRVVPGVGLQSWTRPATVGIRSDAFGLLVFP